MKEQVMLMGVVAAMLLTGCSAVNGPGSAEGGENSTSSPRPASADSRHRSGGTGQVTVDPGIFDRQGHAYEDPEAGWEGPSPYFLVISDQTDKAAQALGTAARRLMYVDSEGNVVTEAELEDPQGWEVYTPNYSSPVYLTKAGPVIYVDTKGELPRAMADAMLRILVEELVAHDVAAHLTTPPLGAAKSIYDSPEWQPSKPDGQL